MESLGIKFESSLGEKIDIFVKAEALEMGEMSKMKGRE